MKKFLFGLVISGLVLARPVLAVAPGCVTVVTRLTVLDFAFSWINISSPFTSGTDVPSLACLADTLASAVRFGVMLLGALTLLYLLFGAIKFVTSRGDQKAVQSAKGTMTYAVIAAVLVLGSYALISFVTNILGLSNILVNFSFYQ